MTPRYYYGILRRYAPQDRLKKMQIQFSYKQVSEKDKKFLEDYVKIKPQLQKGESSFYKKRRPDNSELDITKSIKDQFNLLRICDNENYPAFFFHKNKKYILKIIEEKKNGT